VGYRQVGAYLLGNCTREEMIERGIVATRQLAKRQFTWLRREEKATWLEEGERVVEKALRLAADFLEDSSNRM